MRKLLLFSGILGLFAVVSFEAMPAKANPYYGYEACVATETAYYVSIGGGTAAGVAWAIPICLGL